ncbi:hypothetical protein ACJMK2_005526 [Sinanodonta woodiana]|uniref:Uncharacterized protein n=1 Tax=Sinanodonta woodiana TaxID=1069815 RepID=A0ABD3VQT2_SINWO
MGKKASDNDLGHIVRTVGLIHRRKGMSSGFDPILRNVYHKDNPELQQEILDATTEEVGKFMIYRYASREGLLGMTPSDCPNIELINGPKHLINRIKKIKRVNNQED